MWFRKQRKQVQHAMEDAYDRAVTQPIAQLTLLQRMANKIGALLVVYFLAIVAAGLAFAYFEGASVWDGFWWANVTATSTGYGDKFPVGVFGRIVGMLLMTFTIIFLIPIITARWSAQLIVDSDAFTHQEQEELKDCIKELMVEVDEMRAVMKKLNARLDSESS